VFVVPNLVVETVFFAIQLMLLSLGDVATILAGVTTLLPMDRTVFVFQLSIMTMQITQVSVDTAIDATTSAIYLSATRVALGK
jgi:hypothetical protein